MKQLRITPLPEYTLRYGWSSSTFYLGCVNIQHDPRLSPDRPMIALRCILILDLAVVRVDKWMILGKTFTLSLFPLPNPHPLIEGEEDEVKREEEKDREVGM